MCVLPGNPDFSGHLFIFIFLLFRSADGVPIDSDASPPTTAAKPFASGVPGVVSQPCAAASSASRESSSSSATSTTHGATGSPGATSSTTSSSKKQPHATGRTPPHNMDWPRPGSAMLRLNHYMYRSRDFALRVKACRALPAAGKVFDKVVRKSTQNVPLFPYSHCLLLINATFNLFVFSCFL
jgi:hypothetical protein